MHKPQGSAIGHPPCPVWRDIPAASRALVVALLCVGFGGMSLKRIKPKGSAVTIRRLQIRIVLNVKSERYRGRGCGGVRFGCG